MPRYRFKTAQVQALQWTGSNMADLETFLGYTPELTDDNEVILPSGAVAAEDEWIVIGEYRNIYSLQNDTFYLNLMSEDPDEALPE